MGGQATAPALVIFAAAILTNNILLTNFLGMCSFIAISRSMRTSLGLGAAVTFVMSVTTVLNWLAYHKVLVPLGLDHLTFIVFILVIAGFVQILEIAIERFSPLLYYSLGIFLPLITVNCAVLGAALFMVIRRYDLAQSAAYGAGAGLGWWLVICAMAGARAKLRFSDVPGPLRGLGITLITTGLMAMAFMGFGGMVNIQ